MAAVVLLGLAGTGLLAYRQHANTPAVEVVSALSAPTAVAARGDEPSPAPQPAATPALAQRDGAIGDAALLQQVRRTVRRPGFRPLLPDYLPRGARLDNVNLRPDYPGGPIGRLDIAFVTTGNSLHVRQMSEDVAAPERQEFLRSAQPRRVMAGGREWLYVRRNAESPGVLLGYRDGIVIWLESSLPVEELAKIAASLQD